MIDALSGLVILNTRPVGQQAVLAQLLGSADASVIPLPAIEIQPVRPDAFLDDLASRLADFEIALFVSRNAVEGAFAFIGAAALPAKLLLGVIGDGTRQALAERITFLQNRLISAYPYSSEGLLVAPPLQQVEGKKIIVFRGQQGRNLLGDQLRARGAEVRYCEVYRRLAPTFSEIDSAGWFGATFPNLVIFTSNEGMHNLLGGIGIDLRNRLLQVPWLLISERMRESAVNLGHNASTLIAESASDQGIFQSICKWAIRQPPPQ